MNMKQNNRVYIAGPMGQGDWTVNLRAAIHAADVLLGKGYAPYVPQLSYFWELLSPKSRST